MDPSSQSQGDGRPRFTTGAGGGGEVLRSRSSEGQSQDQPRRRVTADEAAATLDTFASKTIVEFAKKTWSSPKTKVGLLLWILGFSFMVFAPPLTSVSPEMRSNYEDMIGEASNIFNLDDAKAELGQAEAAMYKEQVWFWRWRSPHREIVQELQAIVATKQVKVDQLLAVRESKMRKANAYVGLWSEYGLQDMRERFWGAFESGKVFAMRQTFWQMLISLMSSREEHFLSTLFEWLVTALINFTMGLLGAVFYFAFTLGNLVFSYEAGAMSGIAFYAISLLGGVSLVATYLFALYGMAAGAVYGVGKLVITNAIKSEQQQQRRRLQQQQQQHQHQQ